MASVRQRFKRLQGLFASGNSTASAVLIILGADSRFNGGSSRLFEWLCEGKNPLDHSQLPAAPTNAEDFEDDIEDVLILLDQSCVHLYCNPICLPLLIPFVAKLRNLHLHCLETEQFAGTVDIGDILEEFKIRTFIDITRPHKTIGIPYFAAHSPRQKDFDPMILEKEFPLIQAHAAEEFGGWESLLCFYFCSFPRNGFFTLSHSVIEMTSCLEDLYSELDLPALVEIISKVLPGFVSQWDNGLFALLDSARLTNTIASLKEDRLAEAFRLYEKHWQGQERSLKSSKGRGHQDSGASGVWLGCNTAHMVAGDQQQQVVTVGTSGPGHESCLHMVCRLCAGPLLATRTYFLQNSRQTDHISNTQDMRLLQTLYSCVVTAAHLGMQTFTATQSQSEACRSVEQSIKEQCVKRGVPLPQDFWDSTNQQRSNLVVQVEPFDLCGRPVSLGEDEWSPSLKQMSVCVNKIPCCSSPDLSLGSVAFAETFIDSVVHIKDGWDSQHVVLTTQIPSNLSWPASKADIVHQKEMKEKIQQRGSGHVTDAAPVYVVVSGQLTPQPFTAHLWIINEGFVIEDKHFGLAYLPFEEIKTLLFYSGNSPEALALITVECTPILSHCLPPELLGTMGTGTKGCIVLAFAPQYQTVWRTLYQQILPFLHSLGGQQFQTTEDVPDGIENMYEELQELLLSQPGQQSSHSVAEPTQPLQPHSRMHCFSRHFEVACSLKSDKRPLDSATLQQIVSLNVNGSSVPNDGKMIITMVTGTLGSHQDALCSTLLELGREGLRWTLLRQPFDVTSAFDKENLQKSLSTIVMNLKRKGPTQRRSLTGVRQSRILLVTPWFTDVLEVLQAIATHPDQSVLDTVAVGCVTACVDQNNVYMHDRTLFPNLLENCSEGLVNNIIFTGTETHPNHVSEVERLMRCCNSHASFIIAPKGVITSSSDLDLILAEDVWTSGEILRQRTLQYQGWQRGAIPIEPPNPAFDLICLKFHVPLDRTKLESKLRDLKPVVYSDSVNEEHYAEGLIYHIKGKVALESRLRPGNEAKLNHDSLYGHIGLSNPVELYFTRQSGYMGISELKDVPGQPPSGPYESCIVFAGVGLQENAVKLWLEGCRGETTEPLPLKTKHSLTDKELEQIKVKCYDSPLPDGYFYTGQYYVSFDGQKTLQHPLLEDYVQEYIVECNKEVMLHNKHLTPMFS